MLALLSAARSQQIDADAGIVSARSQVIEAESGIEAAIATLQRLQAELVDSNLTAPRVGRVQ